MSHFHNAERENSTDEASTDGASTRAVRHPAAWSPQLCFRVWFLCGMLGALWCAGKLHKLFLLLGTQTKGWAGALVPLLFVDVLGILLLAWAMLWWLHRAKGWWATCGQVVLHTIVLLGLVLGVIEHRFFTVTQTLISWDMLVYGVRQFVMLADLITSQLNLATGLLLVLPVGLLWLPHWLVRRKWLQPFLAAQAGNLWCSARGMRWFGGIWLMLWLLHPSVAIPELIPLQRNFVLHWAQGAYDSWRREAISTLPLAIDRDKLLFDAQRLRFVPGPKTRKPNVVLIVLESMRWRSTTMARPDLQTTPFLAALAKKSIVVEDMSAVVPHTSKAVVSIFCGIYPKISMEVVEGEVGGVPARCLPALLKSLGYQTAIFHPATLRFENYDQLSANIGFDLIQGMEHFPTAGFFRTNYFGYEDRIMYKPSLRWLDQAIRRKKPFFLAYHTLTSHHGYKTPPQFPMREFAKDAPEFNQYLNALRYTDDFVASLFRAFRERGMMKDTIFVFVADHGEAFGEHKRYQHDNGMWQEINRIPMMLYAPSRWSKGRVIKGPRQQIDIVPTLADLLDVRLAGGRLPGRSLLAPISSRRRLWMSCWYERFCMSMREGPLKYIYAYERRPFELYDLSKDPMEQHNLALLPAYKARVAKAKASLLEWRRKVNQAYETPDATRLKASIQSKAPKVDRAFHVRFGPWVELIGVRLPKARLQPGSVADMTYVFRCLQPIPKGWQFFYHLLATRPERFVNKDHSPLGGRYPLNRWQTGQYIMDRHRFHIPIDFAPGSQLSMQMGLWHKKHKKRSILMDQKGFPLTPKASAYRFQLGSLASPKLQSNGQPPVSRPHNARIGELLRFVGTNLHTPRWTAGKELDLTVVYRVLRQIPKGWRLFFHVDQDKPKQFLNAARYIVQPPPPPSMWRVQQYIQVRLRVPLSKAYFRPGARVRVWTGLWAPAQPRQTVHCEDKEICSDGDGRLLIHQAFLK